MRLIVSLLLACSLLSACRNPGRWNNPPDGIPDYPGGTPPVGYVVAQEPEETDAGSDADAEIDAAVDAEVDAESDAEVDAEVNQAPDEPPSPPQPEASPEDNPY